MHLALHVVAFCLDLWGRSGHASKTYISGETSCSGTFRNPFRWAGRYPQDEMHLAVRVVACFLELAKSALDKAR